MLIATEPVKVKKGVPVDLSLSFDSKEFPVWLYTYNTMRAHEEFEGDSDDGGDAERSLLLSPIALLDKHSWDIGLGWSGDGEQVVAVTMEWTQLIEGERRTVLKHDYPSRTLEEGAEAALYQDGVYFQPVNTLPAPE